MHPVRVIFHASSLLTLTLFKIWPTGYELDPTGHDCKDLLVRSTSPLMMVRIGEIETSNGRTHILLWWLVTYYHINHAFQYVIYGSGNTMYWNSSQMSVTACEILSSRNVFFNRGQYICGTFFGLNVVFYGTEHCRDALFNAQKTQLRPPRLLKT